MYKYIHIHIYSPGLAQRVRSHTKHLTKHMKHCTFDLKQNTKHITLCTLYLHFAFDTKHISLCAHEKALALSSWGLRIWQWSPWSLPGVSLESPWSLVAVYSQRCHTSLRPNLELSFSHTVLDPFLNHFWTEIDPKWVPKMDQNRCKIALHFGPFTCTVFGTFFLKKFTKRQLENVDF